MGCEPAAMKRYQFLIALVLFLSSPSWAQDGELIAATPGNHVLDIFQTVGTKIEVTRPEPKEPEKTEEPGIPEGGRELNVLAYSYCLTGRTASGRYTQHGIVAVDPRVIPLGSKLYIPGYGWGIAADTGGAIVGNKIDVWLPSTAACFQWGVRQVKIKVFPR